MLPPRLQLLLLMPLLNESALDALFGFGFGFGFLIYLRRISTTYRLLSKGIELGLLLPLVWTKQEESREKKALEEPQFANLQLIFEGVLIVTVATA